ncbi:MAG: hypothetical protein JWQ35_2157, partial [Bacteriovoracaceae bacterium]|nr:hypothetical protein [Bacteriovoracaceae bacterium]
GATIAIGCEYNPATSEELTGGFLKNDYPRFYKVEDILKLFEGHIKSIIYKHDVRPTDRNTVGAVMTVFELK